MTLGQRPRAVPRTRQSGTGPQRSSEDLGPGPCGGGGAGPSLPRLACWCSLSRDNTLGYPARTCRRLLLPSLPSDAESVRSADIWGR